MAETDSLSVILVQLPNLANAAILVVGIVLALLFWSRHPRVSLLTALGLVVMLCVLLLGAGFQYAATAGHFRHLQPPEVRALGLAFSAARVPLYGLSWGLLFFAIFGRRTPELAPSNEAPIDVAPLHSRTHK